MFTSRRADIPLIFRFSWKYLTIFTVYSAAVYIAYSHLECKFLTIPFLPIGVIGTAVAFYLGFKNNSSYERLWEARRIWGALVNNSRSWAILVDDYITHYFSKNPGVDSDLQPIKKELIYRQIAFVNALRVQLRKTPVWGGINDSIKEVERIKELHLKPLEEELAPFLNAEEINYLLQRKNAATHIIKKQSTRLKELHKAGLLDDFRHMEMERLLTDMYNQQGACERIKGYPFPRQYAIFSSLFVWLFIFLLPFGIINEFAKIGSHFVWLMIPFHILVSWVFMTMEVIGDISENPFENAITDVPMTSICRNIEIDLREILGETQLPPKLEAVKNILM